MQYDGINYIVQHELPFAGKPERVLVWSSNEELVATAVIHHDYEQVFVDYAAMQSEPTTYPYFQYTGPEELASWMIATSY